MAAPGPGSRRGMRLERWLHDWDMFLVIMAVGVLTGVIAFMASDANPGACRHAVTGMHIAARSLTWVCAHP